MKEPNNKFIDWVINNVPTIILAIISIAGGSYGGYQLKMPIVQQNLLDVVLFISIIAIAIVFWLYILWRNISCHSYYYPKTRIKPDYIVLEKKIVYSIQNQELHYARTIKIKSCVDYLMGISDKFLWTGTNAPAIPTIRNGGGRITESDLIGVWRYFEMKFTTPLRKGKESIDIRYDWAPLNDYRSSSPFTSVSTSEPTKKIVIEVKLGAEYADKDLIIEEFQAIEGTKAIDEKICKFDGDGCYKWEERHPKRFRCYRVRWNWNAEEAIPLVQSILTNVESPINKDGDKTDVN